MAISNALKDKVYYPKYRSPSRPRKEPSWLAESFDDRIRKDHRELERRLDAMTVATLRTIQKNRGWKIKETLKQKIVRQLARRMADSDDHAEIVRSLDGEHRHVLAAMSILGGERFLRAADIERTVKGWGALENPDRLSAYLSHLGHKGLAAPVYGWRNFDWIDDAVPRVIARKMPPFLEGLVSCSPDIDFGRKEPADPFALVRTVSQVAMVLAGSPARLRPPGPRLMLEKRRSNLKGWNYDPEEVERRWDREWGPNNTYEIFTVYPPERSLSDEACERFLLLAENEARLEFVFSLMKEIGLIKNGDPATIYSKVKTQFLKREEPEQRAILARAYFRMEDWSELWEMLRENPGLRLKRDLKAGKMTPADLSRTLLRYRRVVLRALAALPDDMWIRVDDLLEAMRALIPGMDANVWNVYLFETKFAWFISKAANDEIMDLSDAGEWDSVVGDFIRWILKGPLRWLGLVEGCYHKGVLAAFRLHDFADLFHDRVEAPLSSARSPRAARGAKAVKFRGETIRIDPSRVSAKAQAFLNEIANLGRIEPGCFVFQLDRARVHRFFESGKTLNGLLKDWKRFLRVPMTKKFHSRIAGWWTSYGEVRIEKDVAVIEFGDDYTLAELKSSTSLEKHLIAEFPPGLAVVKQADVESLRMELERAGYPSKLTDAI